MTISEIDIQIKNLQESQLPFYEKQSQVEKYFGIAISTYLIDKWKTVTGDKTNTPLITVWFAQFSTKISIKLSEDGDSSEITLSHKDKVSSTNVYRMSWYSSSASQDDLRHLFYLEMVGIIANEIRTQNSTLINMIEAGIEAVGIITKLIRTTDFEISGLVSTKQELLYHETIESILKANGVVHPKEKMGFIRHNANYRTRYKSIEIGKTTDKTMELVFKTADNSIQDTYRLPKSDAIRYLVEEFNEKFKE